MPIFKFSVLPCLPMTTFSVIKIFECYLTEPTQKQISACRHEGTSQLFPLLDSSDDLQEQGTRGSQSLSPAAARAALREAGQRHLPKSDPYDQYLVPWHLSLPPILLDLR